MPGLPWGRLPPTPLRVKKAEAGLIGKLNEERIQAAAALAAAETSPIDDMRGGKAYRTHLVKVLVTRAVKEAMARHGATPIPERGPNSTSCFDKLSMNGKIRTERYQNITVAEPVEG